MVFTDDISTDLVDIDTLELKHTSVTYSGPLGDRHTGLGAQTLDLKKRFSSFLLDSFFFNNKYIKVAINDFTMHFERA